MSELQIGGPLLAGCCWLAPAGAAVAGGLERGGYNIDLLFDQARFAAETAVVYVMPQRELDNVVDVDRRSVLEGGDGDLGDRASDGIRDTENYLVPRIGLKAAFGEHLDCLVDYSQPWGAHTYPGPDWAGANSNIQTRIDSDGFGATCSYKAELGRGQVRLIGGAFYQEVHGFKEQLAALLPSPALGTGIGRLELGGEGFGWRIGGAYELPEIALRASLVYNSQVELDRVSGTLDLTELSPLLNPGNPILGVVTPVFGSAAMPQSVELKLQSGIAPGWLAFGSVKWVDWSVLQIVPFCPVSTEGIIPCEAGGPTEVTSIELLYRDGWTLTGGIGHSFGAFWSGALSLSWDRGTATTVGTQSDTWTLVAGAAYEPSPDFELRLGGALGIMTSGSSRDENVAYTYANDFVGAVSAAARFRF
jgi:long-chain fatty acid transport protein